MPNIIIANLTQMTESRGRGAIIWMHSRNNTQTLLSASEWSEKQCTVCIQSYTLLE